MSSQQTTECSALSRVCHLYTACTCSDQNSSVDFNSLWNLQPRALGVVRMMGKLVINEYRAPQRTFVFTDDYFAWKKQITDAHNGHSSIHQIVRHVICNIHKQSSGKDLIINKQHYSTIPCILQRVGKRKVPIDNRQLCYRSDPAACIALSS